MAVNPLRHDPTRTTLLRKKFGEDMRGRFQRLATAIRREIGTEDAFGLAGRVPALALAGVGSGPQAVHSVTPGAAAVFNAQRWEFLSDDKKLEAFKEWLTGMVAAEVLTVAPGFEAEPWVAPYVKSAYQTGLLRAYMDVKKAAHAADTTTDFIEGGKAAFLQQAFGQGQATKKIQLIYTRSFDQLKGVTDVMATQMSRTLAESLANGDGANAAASKLAAVVDGISKKRAQVIANTELVYAHNEGQLDAFEQLNVEEVGVLAEWITAHDAKVCPQCRPLEGTIYKVKEAHGLIPRHPNCRCAWLPAGVGEENGGTTKRTFAGPGQGLSPPGTAPTGETVGQTFAGDEINAKIRESLKAENPAAFAAGGAKAARAASRWKGADGTISSKSHLKPTAKNKAAQAQALAAAKAAKKEALAKQRAAADLAAKVAAVKKAYPTLDDSDFNKDGKLNGKGVAKAAKAKGIDILADIDPDKDFDAVFDAPDLDTQLAELDKVAGTVTAAKAAWATTKAGLKAVAPDLDDLDFDDAKKKLEKSGLSALLKSKGVNGFAGLATNHPDDLKAIINAPDLDTQLAAVDVAAKAHAQKAAEEKAAAEAAAKAAEEAYQKQLAETAAAKKAADEQAAKQLHSAKIKNGVIAKKYDLDKDKGFAEPGGKLSMAGKIEIANKLGIDYAQVDEAFADNLTNAPDAKTQVAMLEALAKKKPPAPAKPKTPPPGTAYGIAFEDINYDTGKLKASGIDKIAQQHGTTYDELLKDEKFWDAVDPIDNPADMVAEVAAYAKKKQAEKAADVDPLAGLAKGAIDKKSGKLTWEGLQAAGTKVGVNVSDFKAVPADFLNEIDAAPNAAAQAQLLKDFAAGKWVKGGAATPQPAPTQTIFGKHGISAVDDISATGKLKGAAINKVIKSLGVDPQGTNADDVLWDAMGSLPNAAEQIKFMEAHFAAPAAPAAPAVKQTDALNLPPIADLTKVKDLPGSTRPSLMVDKEGKNWVMKSVAAGIKPDHLKSEGLADELYRRAGLTVPRGGVVQTAEGPTKLTEFLEGGETLADWKKGKTKKQIQEMHDQIKAGFVADALFANHDVAGLSFDNIFIVKGKAYRIDNGGALKYRAQGGAKANFGGKVLELESLRDKNINAQTAAIFGDLTDKEIEDQTRELLTRKAAILDAVEDPALRATLAARFDDLASRLPAPKAGDRAAKSGARAPEYGVTEQTADRVKKARINGTNIAGDREDIEDNNILVWEEVDTAGTAVTRVQFKVTPAGSKKVEAALGAELQKAKKSAAAATTSNKHPQDIYEDSIVQAAKTVNTHAKDGAYNLGKIKALEDSKDHIEKSLALSKMQYGKKPDATQKAHLDMLEHYLAQANTILDAKAKQGTTPILSPYVYKPPTVAAAPPTTRDFRVRRDSGVNFRINDIQNGRAKATARSNKFSADEAYVIEAEEGIEIKFLPGTTDNQRKAGLALRGTVHITVPEGASTTSIQKAMKTAEALGIDTKPPTPEYEELLYLHRGVYLRKNHTDAAYTAIFNGPDDDATKVKKIKEWAAKKYGVNFDKPEYYNPTGETKTGFGDGFRHWYRWDLPPKKLAKEMDGYGLVHTTGGFLYESPVGAIPTSLRRFLQSGGEFTSTTGRIRKGVSVDETGGGSSSEDVTTGGASYFFTRIKKRESSTHGFFFKVSRLARQDVVTYDRDSFGRIERFDQRKTTTAEYKKTAGNSDNETLFKDGLSLLDDIDFIRVHSKKERDEVIQIFKDNKITHMNDGRPVEDIVVTSDKPPAAPDQAKEFE